MDEKDLERSRSVIVSRIVKISYSRGGAVSDTEAAKMTLGCELSAYMKTLGMVYGKDYTWWADSMAHEIHLALSDSENPSISLLLLKWGCR